MTRIYTIDLTPLQFGMIYHHLREGKDSGADVVQVEVRLEKAADLPHLREARSTATRPFGIPPGGLNLPLRCGRALAISQRRTLQAPFGF